MADNPSPEFDYWHGKPATGRWPMVNVSSAGDIQRGQSQINRADLKEKALCGSTTKAFIFMVPHGGGSAKIEMHFSCGSCMDSEAGSDSSGGGFGGGSSH